jgi:hypothetical protein
MGYYVRTTQSHVLIPAARHADAYAALCRLNDNDSLKTGGSYGGGELSANDPRPAGMTHHPARWFSWMDADYPSKCKTLAEILREVGFDLDEEEDGTITGMHYDSKTGCQDIFLEALAPYVKAGSYIEWQGEEGEQYRFDFNGTSMTQRSGVVTWM